MVSVIVPNYNHARFLGERLDSIFAQTYQDYEVIILDDHSTDNSKEIIERYRENPHVSHMVYNEENSGSTFVQWDRGLALAKGEYVWIAESDDVAESTFLEECIKRLDSNPKINLAFTHSYLIDRDSHLLTDNPDKEALYKGNGIYDGKAFAIERMIYRNSLYNASMIVFRKSALNNVTPFYKTMRHGGDWAFWFDMLQKGKVAEIPQKLNRFRQHNAKVTTKAFANGKHYEEDGECLHHIMSVIQLSKYQQTCVLGHFTRRIYQKTFPNKDAIIKKYPDFYNGTLFDIIVYKVDRWLGLSGLKR